ncbi:MAG TPA: DNA polymerase [Buchnera sp. (in: enterobacteria)]|nr:DNA polymerase [Buchnera sp. (in: enterobacteria)]
MATNHKIEKKIKNKLDTEYTIVSNKKKIEKMLQIIEQYHYFSFTIKTDSLDIQVARITSISLSVMPNQVFYIPIINHDEYFFKKNDVNNNFKKIKNLFENLHQLKIGYNIKKNYQILKKYNIKLSGNQFDTMIASYMLNNTYKKNEKIEDLENLWINKNEKNIDIKIINNRESDINLKLYITMSIILNEEKKTKEILENIEMPLIKVIANIEENGILIDSDILKKQSKKINCQLLKLKEDAYRLIGFSFNILSSKKLKEILLLIEENKNKKNIIIHDDQSHIQKKDVLLNIVKNYRSLYKLKSTYVDTLPKKINKITGRIHTCYNQANTITGRLSSTNPNLQNIPSKTQEGNNIRQAFIASENCYIVSADYSQIELRILAHLSQDKSMIKLFSDNADIHKITASEIFNIPITEVTNVQRQHAKVINFSLIYGMESFGLSKKLKINIPTAKKYISVYFKRYKGVYEYKKYICQSALKTGYVSTLNGRKIYIPNITSKNFFTRKSAERLSINAPIQGTASDIIKLAMIKIYNFLQQKHHIDAKMIMQVHDELVFEIKKEKINSIYKGIRNIMEYSTKLDIPILVHIKIGNNWKENIQYI